MQIGSVSWTVGGATRAQLCCCLAPSLLGATRFFFFSHMPQRTSSRRPREAARQRAAGDTVWEREESVMLTEECEAVFFFTSGLNFDIFMGQELSLVDSDL